MCSTNVSLTQKVRLLQKQHKIIIIIPIDLIIIIIIIIIMIKQKKKNKKQKTKKKKNISVKTYSVLFPNHVIVLTACTLSVFFFVFFFFFQPWTETKCLDGIFVPNQDRNKIWTGPGPRLCIGPSWTVPKFWSEPNVFV